MRTLTPRQVEHLCSRIVARCGEREGPRIAEHVRATVRNDQADAAARRRSVWWQKEGKHLYGEGG